MASELFVLFNEKTNSYMYTGAKIWCTDIEQEAIEEFNQCKDEHWVIVKFYDNRIYMTKKVMIVTNTPDQLPVHAIEWTDNKLHLYTTMRRQDAIPLDRSQASAILDLAKVGHYFKIITYKVPVIKENN